VVELDRVGEGEGLAQAPDPLAGDVEVDGHWLTWHPEQVRFVEQTYDFSCGELRTVLEYRPRDVTARIEILVFCSRTLPTLVMGEVAVEVDGECELTVRAAVGPCAGRREAAEAGGFGAVTPGWWSSPAGPGLRRPAGRGVRARRRPTSTPASRSRSPPRSWRCSSPRGWC